MVEETLERFGRVDVLVNNAGIHRSALPWDVTEEHWDTLMAVNAKAVFFGTQAVLRPMMAARRGSIVSVASMAAKVGSRTSVPVRRHQGGDRQHDPRPSSRLRRVWDPRQLCLSWLRRHGHAGADGRRDGRSDGHESGRFPPSDRGSRPHGSPGAPEEVARVVAFLASPKAAYMTGQAINVSGGLVMH